MKNKVGQQFQKAFSSTSFFQHRVFQNHTSHFSLHKRPQTRRYARNLANVQSCDVVTLLQRNTAGTCVTGAALLRQQIKNTLMNEQTDG